MQNTDPNGADQRKDWFDAIKLKLKGRLSRQQRLRMRSWVAGPLSSLFSNNLRRLAQIYGSDKWSHHWYCQHYERHFASLRKKPIVLLEIGIGGYEDSRLGGASLRMWRKYFAHGRIYGIDLEDKSQHNEARIQTFRGDQSDEEFLSQVIAEIGRPDVIIDDGSHLNQHVVKTFHALFPVLADNGFYAIEDTQTSYWPNFGGSSKDLSSPATSMNMLKILVDGLNHAEFRLPGFVPSYFDQHIVAMHFYHNLVIVRKGTNDEGSNWQ